MQPRASWCHGGEELEMIVVSRKSFRELTCNPNIRTNLEPEEDREVMRRIVIVKPNDDIYNPAELNGQMMALKEQFKARYKLSDLIRAQKNDKMTSNLFKWIRTWLKKKGDLEEDSYKLLSQFYKEHKSLLYLTPDGVVTCRRWKKNVALVLSHHITAALSNGSSICVRRDGGRWKTPMFQNRK